MDERGRAKLGACPQGLGIQRLRKAAKRRGVARDGMVRPGMVVVVLHIVRRLGLIGAGDHKVPNADVCIQLLDGCCPDGKTAVRAAGSSSLWKIGRALRKGQAS